MADLLVQMAFPYNSGIPADVSINTWSFQTGGEFPAPEEIAAITSAMTAFYSPLESFMSEGLGATAGIKIYNLADAEPRTPIGEATFASPVSPGGNPLPDEVAVCLSFRAEYTSGQPPARRRGRVFLGPLSVASSEEDGGGHARPSAALIAAMSTAVDDFQTELAVEAVDHCVFSRGGTSGTIDTPGLYPVIEYWVDDAFDTQRRRGVDPTLQTTLPT